MDINERFWSKVERTPTCWLWTAGLDHGYGAFQIGTNQKSNVIRAHRYSYQLGYGPIPAGKDVLHKCDTPACVRPSHLFVGTDLENHQDKVAKGRQPRGEQMTHAKLTETQVCEIRDLYLGGLTYRALGAMFGVSYANVAKIVRRETWSHLERTEITN